MFWMLCSTYLLAVLCHLFLSLSSYNLTQIVCNVQNPLVLAINAPWGTGKTTFVKLWRNYLENEGLKVIFFNAWETDFAEDPLIALISTLDKWVQSLDDGHFKHKVWSDFKQKLVPKLLKRSAIAGAKLATAGILDIEKDYEKILSDLSGEITGDLIDKFNEKSQAITQFKDVIKKVLDKLPEQQQNLIIFIDELDRCRPTYAIELLERIKHLFDIERLVFILSTDTEQLAHSICAVYGNNFDSQKYLKRFIDLDYSLKEPDLKTYIKSRFQELNLINKGNVIEKQELLCDLLFFFSKRLNLDLRAINLIIQRLRLIISTTVIQLTTTDSIAIVTLVFLREYNISLYKKYQVSQNKFEEIVEFLTKEISVKEATQKDDENYIGCLIKIIAFLQVFRDDSDVDEVEEKILDDFVSKILESVSDIPPVNPHWDDYSNNYKQELTEKVQGLHQEIRKLNIDKPSYMQRIVKRIELLYRINIWK